MAGKRRARGDGGLYKRADGMWIGAVQLPDGPDGKRRRATISSKDKATALAKLRDLNKQVGTGSWLPKPNMTVEDWLTHWVDDIKKPDVDPNTYRSYKGAIKNQIVPFIGTKKLPITPAVVRSNLKSVGEKWSTRTAELTHFVLKNAFEDAIKEGVIAKNPVEYIAKPKLLKKDGKALTADEARQVLRCARDSGDKMLTRWAAALLLGSRQGELLGLERDRVDLANLTVDLSWQLQWLPTKPGASMDDPDRFDVPAAFEIRPLYRRAALTRPKTDRSKRLTPIPGLLGALLEEYFLEAEPNEYGLVWASVAGKPIPNKYDSDAWHAALARAGVTDLRLHDARSTTATLLQEMGVEESVRMQIMGHSSVAAQRGYAHVDLALARKALGNLDGLLGLGRGEQAAQG